MLSKVIWMSWMSWPELYLGGSLELMAWFQWHFVHTSPMFDSSPTTLGLSFSIATLCIIWKGVNEGPSGCSLNMTTKTALTAYTPHSMPIELACSCSGDWNLGVPASMVLVPALAIVSVMTFDNPRSDRTCRVIPSIYQKKKKSLVCVQVQVTTPYLVLCEPGRHTVEPLNKGHFGDKINSAVLSFMDRLSSSQRFSVYWNYRESNFWDLVQCPL